jgi:hypothetical protein
MAKYAWVSVLLSFVVNIFLQAGSAGNPKEGATGQAIVAGFLMLSGVVCGIIALCGIPKYGAKGLLGPALTGILLWLLLAGLAFPVYHQVRERAEKVHAMRSQRVDLTPATHTPGAERLQDAELFFSFDLPAGYQPVPPASVPKQFRYAYVKPIPGEAASAILVSFLGGTILPSEHLRPEHLPPGQGKTLTAFFWRGLPVDGIRVLEKTPQGEFVTFNVQLPLKRRAVQIGFGGPVAREAEIHTLAAHTLATLEGEPNWP